MSSRTTVAFRKAFASLPDDIQDRAREAFELFTKNPHHPGLRLKRVHSADPIYSVRVSLDYRALARRTDGAWIWFWIGSHSDYDKLLQRR